VARLLPPESASIKDVANEIGVGASTLERWRSEALAQTGRERIWTGAARFDAVLSTAAMDETSKSAWCRAKDKALAETAALLVLSKKVAAIFNRDMGEDE
jgi:transposase-like protein